MSDALVIALVCPTPLPAADDLAWSVLAQAEALAARRHRVTVLAPGTLRDDLAQGRALLTRADRGEAAALMGDPGRPRVVCVGRAIRTGRGRSVSGPLDVASGLESALRSTAFDVVHIHDPLVPSPGLTALRHTGAATVATFHRPVVGVAVLGPLVQRALERIDVRLADSPLVQRTVAQVLPGEAAVLAPGAAAPPAPRGSGVAVVARGRDRAGMRFVLGVVAAVIGEVDGPVRLMGPREAPWRTRAAIPKPLRDRIEVVDDDGPTSWQRLLDGVGTVMLGTAQDIDGPVSRMAMAGRRAVLAPRSPEADAHLRHGEDAVVLTPFSRGVWTDALRLARSAPASDAAEVVIPSHADVAEALEARYRDAIARRGRRSSPPPSRVVADLRLRPPAGADPLRLASDCLAAGLDVVAVAGPDIAFARAMATAAPDRLTVIVGQEVRTHDGVVVGLFLTEPVTEGLSLPDTAQRIRAQGGVVVAPHPDTCETPPAAVLREHAGCIDVYELVVATSRRPGRTAGATAQRLGLVVSAASADGGPELLGAVAVSMRPFTDGRDFVAALADATFIRPARPRLARRARSRDLKR